MYMLVQAPPLPVCDGCDMFACVSREFTQSPSSSLSAILANRRHPVLRSLCPPIPIHIPIPTTPLSQAPVNANSDTIYIHRTWTVLYLRSSLAGGSGSTMTYVGDVPSTTASITKLTQTGHSCYTRVMFHMVPVQVHMNTQMHSSVIRHKQALALKLSFFLTKPSTSMAG
jgi:hypothetical protein